MTRDRRFHEIIAQEEAGYVLNPELSYFAVVIPEETTNLVMNPEAANITGYTAKSSTLALSTTVQRRGINGLQVTPTAPNGGVYYLLDADLSQGTVYTFSVDIRGPGRFTLFFGTNAGAVLQPALTIEALPFWNRYELSAVAPGAARSVGVLSADQVAFYVDGFQVEQKEYATTFCSGSIEVPLDTLAEGRLSYGWMGKPHASYSFRTRFALNGGRPVPLSRLGLEVTEFSGFGHLAPELITTQMALRSDRYFVGASLPERQFTIGGWIRGNGIIGLLTGRGAVGTPTAGGNGEPRPVVMHVQFFDDLLPITEMLEIECMYVGGLEGVISSLYQEKVAISMRAWRPFLRAQGNRSVATAASVAKEGNLMAQYANGALDILLENSAFDSEDFPYRTAVASNGAIFVGNGAKLTRWYNSTESDVYEHTNGLIRDVLAFGDYIYVLCHDDDDGSAWGSLKRYNIYTGAVGNVGGATFHCDNGNVDLWRLRVDPVNKRLFVCGNFEELYVNGNPVSGHHEIACCNLATMAWLVLPLLCPNESNLFTVKDVALDGGGRLWACGEFRRRAYNINHRTGCLDSWGLAVAELNTNAATKATQPFSQWISPGCETLTDLDVLDGTIMEGHLSTVAGGSQTITVTGIDPADYDGLDQDPYVTFGSVTTTQLLTITPLGGNQWSWGVYPAVDLHFGGDGFNPVVAGNAIHYTRGDLDDYRDCGIETLYWDKQSGYMFMGGQFRAAIYYDNSYAGRHYVREVSDGIAVTSTLGALALNIGSGLLESHFTLPSPTTVRPVVRDIRKRPEGGDLWVTGRFSGAHTPSTGAGTYIVSPGVINIDTTTMAFKKAPFGLPHHWYPGATDDDGRVLGNGSGLAFAPTTMVGATNAYLPIPVNDADPAFYGFSTPFTANSIAGIAVVAYDYTYGYGIEETPVLNVPVSAGARAVPTLHVRGPCTLSSISNATTGSVIRPNLAIASGETVMFSFSPGPVWIRSTTKGIISYDNFGRDSFPSLGLVSGNNSIVVSVVNGSTAQVYLTWVEEFSSLESAILRSI